MVDEITSNPNRSEPIVHKDGLSTKQTINFFDDIELILNALVNQNGGGGSGDSTTARKNIMLNAFRIAINGGLSLLNMVDGFVDEFEDETGIDIGAGINEIYDPVNKLYQNFGGAVGTDLVPTMTSNTTPSGVCSASSDQAGAPWNAFDDSNTTDWRSADTVTGWLQYQFTSAEIALSISLQASSLVSFVPKDFTVQGSNTGAFAGEETILVTVTNQTGWLSNEIRNFIFTTTGSFQYYRLDITANNGGTAIRVRELEFLDGIGGVVNMTLISNSQVAENIPTEARIILFEEDVDAQILNTDLKAFASRDGGATFSQMTLSDDGDYQSGRRILSGSVDLSGQPSGTNMQYKIKQGTEINTLLCHNKSPFKLKH